MAAKSTQRPYPLLAGTCDPGDFPRPVKHALREESKRVRRSRLPICMYPDCECAEPYDRLECHHIDPKRYQGQGTLENGILFCSNHHHIADRFLISPNDCRDLKNGVNPYGDLSGEQLNDLWTRFTTLTEFSRPLCYRADEVWRELSRVFFAARHHKDRDQDLCLLVCAWVPSDMAAFLTAHIPGRSERERVNRHPRTVIDEYLRESRRFNDHARDPFLDVRNDHIRAVNRNALLQYEEASRILGYLCKTYALTDSLPNTRVPVDHVRYAAYLTRQHVSVLARCGNESSLDLARKAVVLAARVQGEWRDSDMTEAHVRYLQAAVLLANALTAHQLAEEVLQLAEVEQGIRGVIAYRALAEWSLRRQDILDTCAYLARATSLAEQLELHHQLGHLRELREMAEAGVDVSFQKGPLKGSVWSS